MQPLFLKPVFKEMIWGGTALRELFHYDIPSDKTGECWAISAHKNGDCIVETREKSEYSGKMLSEVLLARLSAGMWLRLKRVQR